MLIEMIYIAFQNIMAHKLRSFLTLLGIIIGISTIISIRIVMGSIEYIMKDSFKLFGANMFQIFNQSIVHAGHEEELKRPNITWREGQQLNNRIDNADYVSTELTRGQISVIYKSKSTPPNVMVLGGTPESAPNNHYTIQTGRFINEHDIRFNLNHAVIGRRVSDLLFDEGNGLGESIRIGRVRFKVIGILSSMGNSLGINLDNLVVIPISTYIQTFGKNESAVIKVQVSEEYATASVIDKARLLLRILRCLRPAQDDNFEIFSSDFIQKLLDNLIRKMNIAAIGISSIAFLIAGIGIMNVMFISILERRNEIGIRNAFGASMMHILLQFSAEAVILTQLGAVVGIFIGIVFGVFVQIMIFRIPLTLPYLWIGFSLGVCTILGLLFGLWPALRAARLDPIEALRK